MTSDEALPCDQPPGEVRIPTVASAARLVTQTYTLPALDRLSKAEPTDVQEIVASQLAFMGRYYDEVLSQARRSFASALVASVVGLIFLCGSVGFLLYRQQSSAALVSLISGTLVEFISAVNYYLYGKTREQLADYRKSLDMTQRFVLANSICERLSGTLKHQTRVELVRAIAGIDGGTPSQHVADVQRPRDRSTVPEETGERQLREGSSDD